MYPYFNINISPQDINDLMNKIQNINGKMNIKSQIPIVSPLAVYRKQTKKMFPVCFWLVS